MRNQRAWPSAPGIVTSTAGGTSAQLLASAAASTVCLSGKPEPSRLRASGLPPAVDSAPPCAAAASPHSSALHRLAKQDSLLHLVHLRSSNPQSPLGEANISEVGAVTEDGDDESHEEEGKARRAARPGHDQPQHASRGQLAREGEADLDSERPPSRWRTHAGPMHSLEGGEHAAAGAGAGAGAEGEAGDGIAAGDGVDRQHRCLGRRDCIHALEVLASDRRNRIMMTKLLTFDVLPLLFMGLFRHGEEVARGALSGKTGYKSEGDYHFVKVCSQAI